jgi:hypothetical protein
MRKHEMQQEVFEVAEALIDGKPVEAAALRALGQDPSHREELAAVRATLKAVHEAAGVAASPDLTARILADARCVRAQKMSAGKRQRRAAGAFWAAACVALFAASAWLSFGYGLEQSRSQLPAVSPLAADRDAVLAGPHPDVLRKASVFADALDREAVEEPSPMASREWRMALGHRSNLTAALAALERNPGSKRAQLLAQTSSERLVETQRRIYEKRPL